MEVDLNEEFGFAMGYYLAEGHIILGSTRRPTGIVFARHRDEVAYTDAPQPYGEIFVMRYDGTGVEQLTDNQWEEGTPAWQPMPASQVTGR